MRFPISHLIIRMFLAYGVSKTCCSLVKWWVQIWLHWLNGTFCSCLSIILDQLINPSEVIYHDMTHIMHNKKCYIQKYNKIHTRKFNQQKYSFFVLLGGIKLFISFMQFVPRAQKCFQMFLSLERKKKQLIKYHKASQQRKLKVTAQFQL